MVKVDYVMCAFYEMKMVVVDLADRSREEICEVLIMIMILVGIDWVSRQKMLLPLQAYPRGTLPE